MRMIVVMTGEEATELMMMMMTVVVVSVTGDAASGCAAGHLNDEAGKGGR